MSTDAPTAMPTDPPTDPPADAPAPSAAHDERRLGSQPASEPCLREARPHRVRWARGRGSRRVAAASFVDASRLARSLSPVTTEGLSIEVRHSPRLCYAMQQCAVPWLHAVVVRHPGPAPLRDLTLCVELGDGVAEPWSLRMAEVPAGQPLEVRPELHLQATRLANVVERERTDLRTTVRRGDTVLATVVQPVELLAWNEWPGLAELPGLLAAFVSPNHPSLPPLLQVVADRLEQATGSRALDGYQSGEPRRARAIVQAVHEATVAQAITYVHPPPSYERQGQKVRSPEQVLGERLGTCLDLALLQASLLELAGLRPLLVMQQGHAFVGAWLAAGSCPEPALGPAVELRKRCDLGALVVLESTLACAGSARPFEAAAAAARRRLDVDSDFVVAVDVAAARRAGITPLPPRTLAFAAARPVATAGPVLAPADGAEPTPVTAPAVEPEPAAGPPPPTDRLEHWKQKLLDLSMWNRLLNFAETRKTIPLAAHDLAALEDRVQSGARLRVHGRPSLGEGADGRDLDLVQQRTGADVRRRFLAEELAAGRLRADLDADDLDARLVEIFRHARTSLEESGANTLYLAIGFLHWYESPQSTKLRRAPLLLLPLTAERDSVRDGVRFVLDDAEPRLNQTLLQLLQRDFELRVGLDQLPEDEDGVDVRAVLDAFRQAVLGMPRWEVVETACIGFFSFTKYLMWLDLAARDELLESPVLRHLVETPGAPFAQAADEMPRERLDELDPATVLCPKDADSSQLAAVLAGAAGRTFVLEGPPGTGKSQTITNLVAQALADGKRVLFVAEKRAALEVVQRRLAEIGLGPFCLELHSSKSGPRAVLDQLRAALEVGVRREPADWRRVAEELHRERLRLNTFVEALHRRREHEWSVFDAMGRLVALRGAARLALPAIGPGDAAAFGTARRAVDDLATAGAAIGVPAAAPWWGVQRGDWTPAMTPGVLSMAQRVAAAAASMAGAVAEAAPGFGLDAAWAAGASESQIEALLDLAALFRASSLPPSALLLAADFPTREAALGVLVAAGRRRDAAWAPLAARWQRTLLGLDLDTLYLRFARAADSFFLLRWWRLRGPRRELATVAVGGAVGAAHAVRHDLAQARAVRDEAQRLAAGAADAAVLGAAWNGGDGDWDRIEAWLRWVGECRRLALRLVPGTLQPPPAVLAAVGARLDRLAAGADPSTARFAALQTAADEFGAARRAIGEQLQLDEAAAYGSAAGAGFLAAVEARARGWIGAVPRLRDHCAYVRAAAAAQRAGCAELVDAHARGDVASGDLAAVFERSFLEQWLDTVHAAEPDLARFRGVEHEQAIARFGELDRRSLQLAAAVVAARVAARLPQVRETTAASSELGILERELKKQRRHKPVRRLLAEIPSLVSRLAPCFLMSPLSVVQYLGRPAQSFDLVIFDEASQMPVWDAVPAIGRGRALIVVGDSRQLPPTNFFQRLEQGDETPSDEVPEDLESVLDECGAAGLPRLHLDWHYRSRHESLIAFSNHHYYQNRLLTFPAPVPAGPGAGVRLVRVPGVYDRGGAQHNRIEAEALVAEVVTRLRDPAQRGRSLGIVTFSRAQQVLVEDLLDRQRALHPEIEASFTQVDEPVFVKNLENVQGDERDTILFSICYGPDAAGRHHENYGPINQQGGERRLNVAVTRARRELLVFASMGAEDVANRTAATGARHLRSFLDYAARGPAALVGAVAADPRADVESPFEAAVRDELVRRGHEVHVQVGCSGYRIDLAVVDPRAPGRYLLGIECDGAAYHSAATARDRDRLRAAVLKGLGWRLCRIWSTDFWQDPNGEIERIEAQLAAAAAEPEPQAPLFAAAPPGAPATPVPDQETVGGAPTDATGSVPAPPDPAGPRPYAAAPALDRGDQEQFATPRAAAALRRQIDAVLASEAPLVFDRLARTVAAAWGIGRVTEKVRSRIREALPEGALHDGDVVWRSAEQRAGFTGFRVPAGDDDGRSAEELPAVEVEHAMLWLLRQHGAIAADDLARETARAFGINRLGAVVRDVMTAALERLVAGGAVVRDGSAVRGA